MYKGKKLCLGCNYKEAWIVHTHTTAGGAILQSCNRCMVITVPQNPSVYFKAPYWDYNLHDMDDSNYDPKRGTYITSKQHKAYVLKKLNLQESGDKEHGGRNWDKKLSNQWEF